MVPVIGAVVLFAEIQTGVMLRSLVIAAAVVAPFWFVLRRRVRARTAAPVEHGDGDTAPAAPTLEALVEEIAAAGRRDGNATILVPHGLTMDGTPTPEPVADSIVRDAIRRSGLVPTAEIDTAQGRVIECRPRTARHAAD